MASGSTKPKRAKTRTQSPDELWTASYARPAERRPLYTAADNGAPITVEPGPFAKEPRGGGWGPFAESFRKLNQEAVAALGGGIEAATSPHGAKVQLRPGQSAGAVPLRSPQTGKVVGGFLVEPRFGWSGVGRVLAEIGWAAMPTVLDLPLVPGSGREVPPWVLAGPVLTRLEAMLRAMQRGYQQKEAVLQRPRGRILWARYVGESLTQGHWERLPCRFPDLSTDPKLRQHLRWVVERVREELVRVGNRDPFAIALTKRANALLRQLGDVPPTAPRREELRQRLATGRLQSEALRQGFEAMAWVVEERGLGGGRLGDGLPWVLRLDQLWEAYVEALIRREAARTGGEVRSGRMGETTIPILWDDPFHRSLGHLVPDLVVRRGRSVQIVDAKYRAHLAELDEVGWRRFSEEVRESHRADIHQVLAYAGLFDAEEVTATLVYPLRLETWQALREQGRDVVRAELGAGGRRIGLELRGAGFGGIGQPS